MLGLLGFAPHRLRTQGVEVDRGATSSHDSWWSLAPFVSIIVPHLYPITSNRRRPTPTRLTIFLKRGVRTAEVRARECRSAVVHGRECGKNLTQLSETKSSSFLLHPAASSSRA